MRRKSMPMVSKKVSMSDEMNNAMMNEQNRESRQSRRKSSLKIQSFPVLSETVEPYTVPVSHSRLLSVRDSLEVLKDRRKSASDEKINPLRHVSDLQDQEELIKEEEIVLYKRPSEESQIQKNIIANRIKAVVEMEQSDSADITSHHADSVEKKNHRDVCDKQILPLKKDQATNAPGSLTEVYDKDSSHSEVSIVKISEQKPDVASNGLALETRDSIILRKASLVRRSAEFHVTPQDSIETRKECMNKLKHPAILMRPSKLLSAKNSLEIIRNSLTKLKSPTSECPRRKSTSSVSSGTHPQARLSATCCEYTCRGSISKPKQSAKVPWEGGTTGVRVSQVEVIAGGVWSPSGVSFEKEPTVFLEKEIGSTNVPVGQDQNIDATQKLTNEAEIIGDPNSREGEQTSDEFTTERIHSFIDMIKDHPHLIRLFTSR